MIPASSGSCAWYCMSASASWSNSHSKRPGHLAHHGSIVTRLGGDPGAPAASTGPEDRAGRAECEADGPVADPVVHGVDDPGAGQEAGYRAWQLLPAGVR